MSNAPDRLVRMKADTFRARLRLGMNMPGALHVPETLKVQDDALASLCEALCVDGDLDLRGCAKLKTLPSRLVVRGRLLIDGCELIAELPSSLREVSGLSAERCERLHSIEQIVHCRGSLNVSGCRSLAPIAPTFKAVGRVKLDTVEVRRGLLIVRSTLPETVVSAAAGRSVGEVIGHRILERHPILDAVITRTSDHPMWNGVALFANTSTLIIPYPNP